jgi:hypothetical protein
MPPTSKHASLEKDEHANQAAWEAARGAAWGGTKVCSMSILHTFFCNFKSRGYAVIVHFTSSPDSFLDFVLFDAAWYSFTSRDAAPCYLDLRCAKAGHHYSTYLAHLKKRNDILTDFPQWGAAFAVFGGVAYAFSPLYRGLTVQFKTYVQQHDDQQVAKLSPNQTTNNTQATFKCPA